MNGEFSIDFLEDGIPNPNLQIWKHPAKKQCVITNPEENLIECSNYESNCIAQKL